MSENVLTGEVITKDIQQLDAARSQMLDPRTDSWIAVYGGDARALAEDLHQTEFVPKGLRGNAPATLAVILFGREVGMEPITAMQGLYAVDGRVGLYAETMRAMVLSAGHEYRIVTNDSTRCVIEGRRKGQDEWTRFGFTIQEAKDAGLVARGNNWRSYPADMLLARATARMCRAIFPDAIKGFRAAEEIADEATPKVDASAKTSELAQPVKVARKKRVSVGSKPERCRIEVTPRTAADPANSIPEPLAVANDDTSLDEADPAAQSTDRQIKAIVMHMKRLGITERAERIYWAGVAAGRTDSLALDSTKDLSREEATRALKTLETISDRDGLEAIAQ